MAHDAVVFNNKVWVMGGYSNAGLKGDVWCSSDGTTWTQAVSSAWPARAGLASVVFGGKIWVMGGQDMNYNMFNDVWSSTDGTNWTQETSSAAWSPRSALSCTVFNGEMWVTGGRSNSAVFGDVWHSSDGVNWTRQTGSPGWAPRASHTSLSYNGYLWVMGGSNVSGSRFNDVWRVAGVGISEEEEPAEQTVCMGISPNPVCGVVRVDFTVSVSETAVLEVFDTTGRLVRHLFESTVEQGSLCVFWDCNDDSGFLLGEGVYFIVLKSGNTQYVKTVTVLN
jgi:hypothetical protein